MSAEKNNKLVLRTDNSLAIVGNQIAITSKILKSIEDEKLLNANFIENLFIEGTTTSARIDFKGWGELEIAGRMLDLDPSMSFRPMWDWIRSYLLNPAKTTNLCIDLEYINTGSLKYLMQFINDAFDSIKEQKLNIKIKWYCDKEDENLIELVNNITSKLNKSDVKLMFK